MPAMGPERDLGAVTIVDLRLGQKGYAVGLPMPNVLSRDSTVGVQMIVRSAKSSQSRFNFLLETTDGRTFKSKEIELTAFVARTLDRWRP
jgi:hypothetical protein